MEYHTCELADQSFSSRESRNDTSARYALDHVVAVPSYEMAIVDDVLLARRNLQTKSAQPFQFTRGGIIEMKLTSFLIIAPKLQNHRIPVPAIRYVNQPSPENIILLKFCAL